MEMDAFARHQLVKRYAALKQRKVELEDELQGIRSQLLAICEEQQVSELASGRYVVRLVHQERKDYDDAALFEALPDPALWRMVSRADGGKVAGLLKIGVLTHDMLRGTYEAKRITLLHVDKT